MASKYDNPRNNRIVLVLVGLILLGGVIYVVASGQVSAGLVVGVVAVLILGGFVYRKRVLGR